MTARIATERLRALSIRAASALQCAWAILFFAVAAHADAQLSVPPAHFSRRAPADAYPNVELRTPSGATRRVILLPSPTAAESAALRRDAASADARGKHPEGRSSVIGFSRDVPAADAVLPLADLPWHGLADGTRIARIELTSPGAVAIRLRIGFEDSPEGLKVRLAGSADARVFAIAATAIVAADEYWSPVLEGESASLEVELPPGTAPGKGLLRLPSISHLGTPGGRFKSLISYIGQADSCEIDVACLAPGLQQQMASATNAVARLIITAAGTTYLCSGTLLNDSRSSFTPYFLAANHCVTGLLDTSGPRGVAASAAATANTYWFFQASTCGSQAAPNYTQLADGATLLARSVDYDWAMLRLNSPPPSGATLAAWNAAGPLDEGMNVSTIHHPEGDLKKVSQGTTLGYSSYSDGSTFIRAQWTIGATEPGSSGAGLFAPNPASGIFELRGSLAGGPGTCNAYVPDEFSRFDAAFPLVSEYLAPDAPNTFATTSVTEFYSASSDDYLLTADPAEVGALDQGATPGWVRTGLRFLAYASPDAAPMSVQPVCRLRSAIGNGVGRIYTASAQECAALATAPGPVWVLERAAAFYVALPDALTGACPPETRPVYRLVNTINPPRRRYSAEVDVRDAMLRSGGWSQEGFGIAPNQVAMCAATAGPSTLGPQMPSNYEGLWWADPAGSESGWGLSLAHQGDTLFVGWFSYDLNGNPRWLSLTATNAGPDSYSGLLTQSSGPPFDAIPFDPNQVARTTIGAATLTFSDSNHGTFSYAVAGAAQTKPITRFSFGSLPTCMYEAAPDFATATNYQDVWSVPGESGWGLMLTHQGDVIVAAWFTYSEGGAPLWLTAVATKIGPGQYSGQLTQATGPPFNSVPFDPSRVTQAAVGSMSLAFAGGNQATFTYSMGGRTQSKTVTRLLFSPPAGTICH